MCFRIPQGFLPEKALGNLKRRQSFTYYLVFRIQRDQAAAKKKDRTIVLTFSKVVIKEKNVKSQWRQFPYEGILTEHNRVNQNSLYSKVCIKIELVGEKNVKICK
jgi:hypothetical protein